MQRWHLTAGLVPLALAGAILAPRLLAAQGPTPSPVPVTTPPAPSAEPAPGLVAHRIDPTPAPATAPVRAGSLVVEAGLDRTAVLEGRREERFLTIIVSAPAALGEGRRQPVDLAVVLDTSGSMRARGKLDYARQAARVLAGSMRAGDRFSVVTFSDEGRVLVPPGPVENVAAVHRALDRVQPAGATNLWDGLSVARRALREDDGASRVRRVVVLSDGKATAGRTDGRSLAEAVTGLAADGASVSTVGLGLDFDEDRLVRLADLGGGSYDYVDSPRDLQQVFTDELDRTTRVVARRTTLDITLPPHVEGLEVLGWGAERTAEGWRVALGDVHAGETRTVVARVRVTGPAEGSVPVGQARADYVDLVQERPAISQATAAALVTTDPTLVAQAWDRDRTVAARRAWGHVQAERASRAYAAGDVGRARALADEGAKTLRRTAIDFDMAPLVSEAEEIDALNDAFQSAAPETATGRHAIKKAKELSYERAR
jgi:Ca-activated chloride channel homolog